ncbi:MAG: agmatine deiminase family protein [Candidatus Micrarchaeota archaeon]
MHMPAEWEPHEATWLSWPKDPLTFPDGILPKVEETYVEMILALTPKEKVHLLVDDEKTEKKVLDAVQAAGSAKNLLVHRIRTVDVWMRDYGPIFVRDGPKLKMTKWIFNAWGGKYEELMKDNSVADSIAPMLGMDVTRPGVILEGGSIDVNGRGTLLTTEQCLLNKNRNKGMGRGQIEEKLREHLGAKNIVWLREGIEGDDTDGHIDDIARFVDERTVLCAFEQNPDDANYPILKRNFEDLQKAKDQDGEPLIVKPLPMPGPVRSEHGRLPASYANFYIGNAAVLLPVFRHENDEKAISLLEEHFPGRKVVPIWCGPLVHGLGAIHCVTQQQPFLV